ncbi:MAG: DUF1326 domain-containing protein [Bryobacteraceae bacterium]|nr:DUF1326 domain-containing protein [Bryobacteraceae bacterium]
MRNLVLAMGLAGSLMAASLPTSSVRGNYVEARNADVYTGACFANSEAGNMGELAVFGWKVDKGTFKGVNIDGLSVVGVVKAKGTLGNQFGEAYPVKSVLIVDERATPEQRLALRAFAQRMSGDLLENIVKVDAAPISLEIENGDVHGAKASLSAGSLAFIRTRAVAATDHICGHEEAWYSPLSKVDHAMPAVTLAHDYKGEDLGSKWSSPNKRGAFVANFSLSE